MASISGVGTSGFAACARWLLQCGLVHHPSARQASGAMLIVRVCKRGQHGVCLLPTSQSNFCRHYLLIEEEEELHQSSQMRLIRRNFNTRIEDPSTNLETVMNIPYDPDSHQCFPFIFTARSLFELRCPGFHILTTHSYKQRVRTCTTWVTQVLLRARIGHAGIDR
jgi:hypothetical protein